MLRQGPGRDNPSAVHNIQRDITAQAQGQDPGRDTPSAVHNIQRDITAQAQGQDPGRESLYADIIVKAT